jgi:hypothetical protein
MSEQLGVLFLVLFVVAVAGCIYLSITTSMARLSGDQPLQTSAVIAASSRLWSKGAVDIGCHSMYGMVCGRQLPVLDLNHETRGGSPICVSLPSQNQARLQ